MKSQLNHVHVYASAHNRDNECCLSVVLCHTDNTCAQSQLSQDLERQRYSPVYIHKTTFAFRKIFVGGLSWDTTHGM